MYNEKTPVRVSAKRMDYIRENYPTLVSDIRFIETAKEVHRQYVWANDISPWKPENNPNADYAYYVSETAIDTAARVFLESPIHQLRQTMNALGLNWRDAQETIDTRSLDDERQPYAGGFEGGFDSPPPESNLDYEA